MPTVAENREHWSQHEWTLGGDEWSDAWGGSDGIWFGTLLPRLHPYLPTGRLLEIAPGFGRVTRHLLRSCTDFVGVDVTPRCVEHCRGRFATERHARFFANDGCSLDMIEDDSVDVAISWDSLVHAEADVLRAYLRELGRTLKPGGIGFIHHSNLGAHRGPDGLLTVENPHWRASTMSAGLFQEFCREAGLSCVSQELVSWAQEPILNDCFSLFLREDRPSRPRPRITRRPDFMKEVAAIRELRALYRRPKTIFQSIDWRLPAIEIVEQLRCVPDLCYTASLGGRDVELHGMELATDPTLAERAARPGIIVKATPHAVVVATGQGHLVIRRLATRHAEGSASEFVQEFGVDRFDLFAPDPPQTVPRDNEDHASRTYYCAP